MGQDKAEWAGIDHYRLAAGETDDNKRASSHQAKEASAYCSKYSSANTWTMTSKYGWLCAVTSNTFQDRSVLIVLHTITHLCMRLSGVDEQQDSQPHLMWLDYVLRADRAV